MAIWKPIKTNPVAEDNLEAIPYKPTCSKFKKWFIINLSIYRLSRIRSDAGKRGIENESIFFKRSNLKLKSKEFLIKNRLISAPEKLLKISEIKIAFNE